MVSMSDLAVHAVIGKRPKPGPTVVRAEDKMYKSFTVLHSSSGQRGDELDESGAALTLDQGSQAEPEPGGQEAAEPEPGCL